MQNTLDRPIRRRQERDWCNQTATPAGETGTSWWMTYLAGMAANLHFEAIP